MGGDAIDAGNREGGAVSDHPRRPAPLAGRGGINKGRGAGKPETSVYQVAKKSLNQRDEVLGRTGSDAGGPREEEKQLVEESLETSARIDRHRLRRVGQVARGWGLE